ncbi:MAG: L-serine ammonia-lyase, iron-sulfur-dependent, subunit alpha [Butyrivibrio sp.]|uniref:L-serine ammonia-lyase, iron-sulfur-dependent, subunit alpha n=1 Tax=Butyrivibrio sp. TaxID=28121 RepID=UPI0025C38876|nr:L-serine ammonia-lyase, iron-sulfur-dependent, subunit alpha [Butyrivibrio sp.]MBQ6589241.1 L-serine ammonia-lyase, iron-sulfur-dependent, subunit alpha [Butyrivibrio sp.]
MAKIFYPDFFNDVFGPIMQPGSSGGFAGPARIGNVARHLIKEEPKKVVFSLQQEDIGRFKSLGNFMTDRGYLGGVQGFATDDKRLFDAHRLAQEKKLSYEFRLDDGNFGYFRAVKINVYGESSQGELIGASVGGGMIRIYEAYGYKLNWQADTFGTLVIGTDTDLDNLVSKYIEKFGDHVVEHRIVTNADDREALFIETDIDISDVDDILAGGAGQTVHLPAVLPVVTTKAKKKQLFTTVEEWRQVASDRGISFLQAAIEYEKDASGWSEEEIWAFFIKIRDIFDKQIHSLEELDYDAEDTPTLPIYGKLWKKYLDGGKVISDSLTRHILTHAYATNAKVPGFKIVPGPMGTGGGYLYSALDAVREDRGFSRERELEALVIAAALGALAYTHTNASGDRGCIGESGVCNAMAAGAIAYLITPDDPLVDVGIAVERAASMALQANMGLVCDPIPGGLEFPCITRTLRAAVTAPMYAEMAIIGIDPLIPYHECLQAMERHYRLTPPERLCGSDCGTCTTPAAQKCKQFLSDLMADNLKFEAV